MTHLVVLQEIIYLFSRWAKDRQQPKLREIGLKVAADAMVLVEEVLTPTMLEFTRAFEGFDPHREDFNNRLILEGMRTHKLRRILTADRGFTRYPELEVLDPVAFQKELKGA